MLFSFLSGSLNKKKINWELEVAAAKTVSHCHFWNASITGHEIPNPWEALLLDVLFPFPKNKQLRLIVTI